ncbi:MAG: sugar ABC transporter permease [Actinobacteria bacterium]|nr:sugar ABC transporter permease [Actinomycetota bacterium]
MTTEVIAKPTPSAPRRAVKKRKPYRGKLWWRYLAAAFAVSFALAPIVYVVLAACNPAGTLSTLNFSIHDFGLDNFRFLLGKHDLSAEVTYENYPYLLWYRNSLMVSSIAAIMQVTIGTASAYAFSRIHFKGRRLSLGGLLLLQMFPQILSFIALFLIMQNIGAVFPFMGTGTWAGLVLIYLGGAMGYNTYLLKGFFDTIPRELDEAATMDGASANQIFFKIILPLATPMLAVVMLLAFIGLMNDFILASIFLTKSDQMTLAVGLRSFISGRYESSWGVFAAGALMAALPVVILFQVLQRYIVEGLSAGSVKG